MKPSIIHSIVICLATLVLPVMVACSSQEESLPEDTSGATLFLNIAPIGQTRAGTADLPDNEKMHSLRIIVLHENGAVEHNKYYDLDGALEYKTILLKVTPKEKKKIFLFANEESVTEVEGVTMEGTDKSLTAFFGKYAEDTEGFENAVNGLYFAPGYTKDTNIPMSSMYEIDVRKEYEKKEFYVVRVATKFTVNFENLRKGDEVTVNSFSIAKHADKNFLMAHVNDTPQNQALFRGKSWIDWLKEVSDASSENDSYETTEAAGWLKDYELPGAANEEQTYTWNTSVTVAKPTIGAVDPDKLTAGKAEETPVFYLPESKNPKAGATDGEQEYTMTLNIDGHDKESFTLPNLKSLFRNTHVIVNVKMDYDIYEVVIFVRPWNVVKHEEIVL